MQSAEPQGRQMGTRPGPASELRATSRSCTSPCKVASGLSPSQGSCEDRLMAAPPSGLFRSPEGGGGCVAAARGGEELPAGQTPCPWSVWAAGCVLAPRVGKWRLVPPHPEHLSAAGESPFWVSLGASSSVAELRVRCRRRRSRSCSSSSSRVHCLARLRGGGQRQGSPRKTSGPPFPSGPCGARRREPRFLGRGRGWAEPGVLQHTHVPNTQYQRHCKTSH